MTLGPIWTRPLLDLHNIEIKYVAEKLAAASGRRRWPICWCCLHRGPGSFDVEDATTLSWSSAAVSE